MTKKDNKDANRVVILLALEKEQLHVNALADTDLLERATIHADVRQDLSSEKLMDQSKKRNLQMKTVFRLCLTDVI